MYTDNLDVSEFAEFYGISKDYASPAGIFTPASIRKYAFEIGNTTIKTLVYDTLQSSYTDDLKCKDLRILLQMLEDGIDQSIVWYRLQAFMHCNTL